ncbi:hypothetical protein [Pseudoxanthomonas gei]|nr:hypothetical protein [Pseudoxanthomonas gei]
MRESTFIESIECRFPYQDRLRALEITEEACSISANAAFAVVDELSRPPAGEAVSLSLSTELLSLIELRIPHPLAQPILSLARKLVSEQLVSVLESLFALRQVERFPGQYAALSIAYFACDDVDGIADLEFNRIRAAWDAA